MCVYVHIQSYMLCIINFITIAFGFVGNFGVLNFVVRIANVRIRAQGKTSGYNLLFVRCTATCCTFGHASDMSGF